jgi:hypothetical protein
MLGGVSLGRLGEYLAGIISQALDERCGASLVVATLRGRGALLHVLAFESVLDGAAEKFLKNGILSDGHDRILSLHVDAQNVGIEQISRRS